MELITKLISKQHYFSVCGLSPIIRNHYTVPDTELLCAFSYRCQLLPVLRQPLYSPKAEIFQLELNLQQDTQNELCMKHSVALAIKFAINYIIPIIS